MTDGTRIRHTNPLTAFLASKGFILVLRLFLGGIFIYSSIHKIHNPEQFAVSVRAYQIIPLSLSNLYALLVAWSEAVAAIMLIFGIMTRKAAAAILILLVMFIIAIITTLIRGLTLDCGCFSSAGGHSTNFGLIVQDLFLVVAAVMVMRFDAGFLSLSKIKWARRPNAPAGTCPPRRSASRVAPAGPRSRWSRFRGACA